MKRNEEHLQDTENCLRRANLRITMVQEGIEKKEGAESLFKQIITEKIFKPSERHKCPGTGRSEITQQI